MRKFINSMSSALVLATMLQGCVSPSNGNVDRSEQLNLETQERVLLASNNTVGLIEFYQNQLKDAESEHYRIKLAEVYLKKHDPESALFVLTPLTDNLPSSAESTLVAAKAHMDLGQFEVALGMLENAYEQSPVNGEVANLLGVVYAETGQFKQARTMFEVARTHFYSDLKIKNNLALLDILEGNYAAALERISSVATEPSLDKQTRANLLLVMAKNGQQQLVMQELDDSLTENQKMSIYLALKNSDLKTSHGQMPVSNSVADTGQSTILPNVTHELHQ